MMTVNLNVALITLVSAIATLLTFIVKLMVKSALEDFLVKLNGTYVRSQIFTERLLTLEARISKLEPAPHQNESH